MTFKKILRVIVLAGIPLIFLLELISFAFIIMHWEGASVLASAIAPFILVALLAGFLYAVLVKPQPKFQKPDFDFDRKD